MLDLAPISALVTTILLQSDSKFAFPSGACAAVTAHMHHQPIVKRRAELSSKSSLHDSSSNTHRTDRKRYCYHAVLASPLKQSPPSPQIPQNVKAQVANAGCWRRYCGSVRNLSGCIRNGPFVELLYNIETAFLAAQPHIKVVLYHLNDSLDRVVMASRFLAIIIDCCVVKLPLSLVATIFERGISSAT